MSSGGESVDDAGPVARLFGGAPPAALAYLAGSIVLAVVVSWAPFGHISWDLAGFEHTLLLGIVAIAFEEVSTRAARERMRFGANLTHDLTSVWSFGAAIALPRAWAVLLILVILTYTWQRQDRPAGLPTYRALFNITNVVLSCLAAATTLDVVTQRLSDVPDGFAKALPIVAAMAVYALVNRALVTGFLICRRVPIAHLRGTRDENLIEFATLCLGGLVALAFRFEPWLALLVVAPLVALQRGARIREFEAAATTDTKTGLLNALAWDHTAKLELTRAIRTNNPLAVLMIDVDRFKPVNDRYGHLVGDLVLKAIGQCLEAAVREYDTVGRFGGEEFVAVLPDADDRTALLVAERLRARVRELPMGLITENPAAQTDVLTVSIGVARLGADGHELPELLQAADLALYRAKTGGRDCVRLAHRGDGTVPDLIDSV